MCIFKCESDRYMGKKINIDDVVGNWGLSIIYLFVDFFRFYVMERWKFMCIYRVYVIERWEFNVFCYKIIICEEIILSV